MDNNQTLKIIIGILLLGLCISCTTTTALSAYVAVQLSDEDTEIENVDNKPVDRSFDYSSTNYNDLEITLERFPCFGFCPTYKLTIEGDGDATFEGYSYVANEDETIEYELTRNQIEKIVKEIGKVKFFEKEDEYVDDRITDLDSVALSVSWQGEYKRIYMYGLEDTVPEELRNLADKIDEYAETEELTEYEFEL